MKMQPVLGYTASETANSQVIFQEVKNSFAICVGCARLPLKLSLANWFVTPTDLLPLPRVRKIKVERTSRLEGNNWLPNKKLHGPEHGFRRDSGTVQHSPQGLHQKQQK